MGTKQGHSKRSLIKRELKALLEMGKTHTF
jgi:hypothetical protein